MPARVWAHNSGAVKIVVKRHQTTGTKHMKSLQHEGARTFRRGHEQYTFQALQILFILLVASSATFRPLRRPQSTGLGCTVPGYVPALLLKFLIATFRKKTYITNAFVPVSVPVTEAWLTEPPARAPGMLSTDVVTLPCQYMMRRFLPFSGRILTPDVCAQVLSPMPPPHCIGAA